MGVVGTLKNLYDETFCESIFEKRFIIDMYQGRITSLEITQKFRKL